MKRWNAGIAVLGVLLAVAGGCGDDGGSSSAPAEPGPQEVVQAQKADAAAQAVEETTEIATDAIVESGAPGATSAKSAPTAKTAARTFSPEPSPAFAFQGAVSLEIDLDAKDAEGNDRWPNASGVFTVNAAGAVSGTSAEGKAQYAVEVRWVTEGVFRDPVCGAEARIAPGSGWTYGLALEWSRQDDLNWSLRAAETLNGSGEAVVTHQEETAQVTCSTELARGFVFTRSSGAYFFAAFWSGRRTVTITQGAETHTVEFLIEGEDRIRVVVDGVSYGPFTRAQLAAIFRFDCDE
ncbi:MAG TPA: hypothetical protein VNO22_13515 [Planctomycetota bacterium]|nr:hypothetical protein [Planctomycetota bacterium]